MPQITPDATELLIHHEWRGNIRELRNTLEQLVVLVCSIARPEDRCVITRRDVERALSAELTDLWTDGRTYQRSLPAAPTSLPKEQTERELIYRALLELRGEIAEIKSMLSGNTSRTAPATNTLALPPSSYSPSINSEKHSAIRPLDELETEALEQALQYYRGNRRHAAQALGISERTLYRKMKEKGLE
jgi:DNA-binding NtrC family response regulator